MTWMRRYARGPQRPEWLAKRRAALMRTLKIPEGHRRVYGVFVPEEHWHPLQYHAARISAQRGFDVARQFVLECKASGWEYEYVSPAQRSEYWADWKLAKALYEDGVSVQEIAEFYRMDPDRVDRARRRKWTRGL